MKPYLLLCLFVVAFCQTISAQNSHVSSQDQHLQEDVIGGHHKNFIGMFSGITTITESQFQLPTVGLEYIRELKPNFGIGILTELEMGTHIWINDEEGNKISEVKRESALLVLPGIYYRPFGEFIFSAGYGVEFEQEETLPLFKLGVAYKFKMYNPNWIVLPTVSWDHTHVFNGLVYGVTFGYRFN